MHTTFFGLKRAYLGTLRLTRRALARIGLTAARFDLLYILLRGGEETLQRELREELGVSGATVSRMLASLEELGLVRREPLDTDHRHRCVSLTKEGRRLVRTAARHFIRSGFVQLAVDSALCPGEWFDTSACGVARVACEGWLWRLREAYFDIPTLDDHVWGPDVHVEVPAKKPRAWRLMLRDARD
jgi:DNA-binding MarR family transcriptional regulator